MFDAYQHYCEKLEKVGTYRTLPDVTPRVKGTFVDFSTNDYLGFSRDPALLQAAMEAGTRYGVGATGSRLLSGNHALFETLEARIAASKGTEAALLFNTGFQANLTVLASLCYKRVLGHQPIVFFDKLNHTSLYQAIFLSGALLVRYHHNDMCDLAEKMARYAGDPRCKFIVSETIFGMDGDVINLVTMAALAKHYGALLYLDEAHATGVVGPQGYGLSTTVDLTDITHVIMGTFSKGLGCAGAYVACSTAIKDYMINKAAGFITSTAASPMVVGACLAAWNKVSGMHDARVHLAALGHALRERLQELGFNTGLSTTHIVPIILQSTAAVVQAKEKLLARGIVVSAIRPPTVPPNTARLRVALTAHHTTSDLDRLAEGLENL